MKLSSQSLQVGPQGSQGSQGPAGPPGGILVTPPVLVSSANILALHLTPKQLIAAPDPDELIVVVYTLLYALPGVVPYAAAGGTNLQLGWPPADLTFAGAPDALAVLNGGVGGKRLTGLLGSSGGGLETMLGQPFVLTSSAALTLGNGTMLVTVAYFIA